MLGQEVGSAIRPNLGPTRKCFLSREQHTAGPLKNILPHTTGMVLRPLSCGRLTGKNCRQVTAFSHNRLDHLPSRHRSLAQHRAGCLDGQVAKNVHTLRILLTCCIARPRPFPTCVSRPDTCIVQLRSFRIGCLTLTEVYPKTLAIKLPLSRLTAPQLQEGL